MIEAHKPRENDFLLEANGGKTIWRGLPLPRPWFPVAIIEHLSHRRRQLLMQRMSDPAKVIDKGVIQYDSSVRRENLLRE